VITKRIIDLLDEEDNPDLPPEMQVSDINDIFTRNDIQSPETDTDLTTKKKFQILDWNYIDRQLRSYGFDKIDDISLHFIGDNDKKHISNKGTETEFDFSSESIPFSTKYNIAFAISYSEAIGILSSGDDCEIYASEEIKKVFAKYGVSISDGINRANFGKYPLEMRRSGQPSRIFIGH
jgi:hypothetical protein